LSAFVFCGRLPCIGGRCGGATVCSAVLVCDAFARAGRCATGAATLGWGLAAVAFGTCVFPGAAGALVGAAAIGDACGCPDAAPTGGLPGVTPFGITGVDAARSGVVPEAAETVERFGCVPACGSWCMAFVPGCFAVAGFGVTCAACPATGAATAGDAAGRLGFVSVCGAERTASTSRGVAAVGFGETCVDCPVMGCTAAGLGEICAVSLAFGCATVVFCRFCDKTVCDESSGAEGAAAGRGSRGCAAAGFDGVDVEALPLLCKGELCCGSDATKRSVLAFFGADGVATGACPRAEVGTASIGGGVGCGGFGGIGDT